jgi:ferredoxin
MGTGPETKGEFDLCVTELLEGEHRFMIQVGSETGANVIAKTPHSDASKADEEAAKRCIQRTVDQITRKIDTTDIKELLYRNVENPLWDEIATRCLCCANCTMVCPTCFCNTLEDSTNLTGSTTSRLRKWDSCFTSDFTYIHGGSVRLSPMSRYRQWMTHKLASWHDQFGTSGCVGCGRCITWCPVGIDITEEARAIRANDVGEVSQS